MHLKKLVVRSQKGQGMAEYSLILGLVAAVVAAAFTTMGTDLSGFYNTFISRF